jgi:hypothetical protein
MHFLSGLSGLFGQSLSSQFTLPQLLALGDDPSPRVRRETVLAVTEVVKVVAEGLGQRLEKFYETVSRDKDWIVRKALVEVIAEIIPTWLFILKVFYFK